MKLLITILSIAATFSIFGQGYMQLSAPSTIYSLTATNPVGGGIALTTNLVAYWDLDETSGDRADSVGSSTMYATGAVSYVSGKIGNAGSFDGNSAIYLSTPGNATLSMGSNVSYSISLWFYQPSVTTGWLFARGGDTAGGTEYSARPITGGYASAKLSDGTTLQTILSAAGVLSASNWYHMVYRVDTGAGKGYLSINNTTHITNTVTYAQAANQILYLSRNSSGGAFTGYIDEFGIWKRCLTWAEVGELYNSGSGKTYPFSP